MFVGIRPVHQPLSRFPEAVACDEKSITAMELGQVGILDANEVELRFGRKDRRRTLVVTLEPQSPKPLRHPRALTQSSEQGCQGQANTHGSAFRNNWWAL